MMFNPKLVALDIDGTLVDWNGVMPDPIRRAVRRVVDAGVPVVLSTGRSWVATEPIFAHLELPPGWAVSSNGAIVVTNPPFKLQHETLFDPRETIEKVSRFIPRARIAVERGMKRYASAAFPDGELQGDVEIVSVEELGCAPVSRLIIREPDADGDAEGAVFDDLIRELGMHEVSYFVGWSAWLDIAPVGVDKAHGLSLVCRELGLTQADVLAIGDGRNDIEMLQWAGRGVAMGDAPDEVKAAADAVTGNFADLGTVEELERWFPALAEAS